MQHAIATERNAVPPVNRRFLNSLTPDADAAPPGGAQKYLIGGMSWYGAPGAEVDSVWRFVDGIYLRYVRAGKNDYEWRANFNIGGDVWMDITGAAATIEEACAEAMACTGAPVIEVNYAGIKTQWHLPTADAWVASLDGDAARIFIYNGNFFWSRKWAPGADVLAMVNSARTLEGSAPSLEEAMFAAFDAPEHFKRACSKLLIAANK